MKYSISGGLEATVDSLGAQLVSLKDVEGHEYLWQGDEASWNGQSPVLFPVIGGLPNGRYSWQGSEYEMDSHGFARKKEWSQVESRADRLVFELTSGDETRRQYPFDFTFRMIYTAGAGSLTVGYDISNEGSGEMPFSIGGHPGFNCPLESGLSFEDYRIRFDGPEDTVRLIKSGNLLSGETRLFRFDDGILNLDHDRFKDGAYILRDFRTDSLVLESERGRRSVRVDFAGFPDLGIWTHSTVQAPYVCIEPWFGVDSTAGVAADTDFATKSGMVHLPPGERFHSEFTITIA